MHQLRELVHLENPGEPSWSVTPGNHVSTVVATPGSPEANARCRLACGDVRDIDRKGHSPFPKNAGAAASVGGAETTVQPDMCCNRSLRHKGEAGCFSV